MLESKRLSSGDIYILGRIGSYANTHLIDQHAKGVRTDKAGAGSENAMQVPACQSCVGLRVGGLETFPHEKSEFRYQGLRLVDPGLQWPGIELVDDTKIGFLLCTGTAIKAVDIIFDPVLVPPLSDRTRCPDENRGASLYVAIN